MPEGKPPRLHAQGADIPPGIEHRPGKDIAVSLSGDDVDEDRTLTLLG
ncbi:MAG TPA: hypothetical protein VII16_04155 [Actinomycetes bacterium]